MRTHIAELQPTEVDAGPSPVDAMPPIYQRLAGEDRCPADDQRRTDADDAELSSAEHHGSHPGKRPATLISPSVSC